MKVSQSLLIVASALSSASLTFAAEPCAHKVKESIPYPKGWVKQLPAPADHIINLRIGLPQPNFNVLETHLYEISDPDHPRYGAHLSKEEVEAIVAPHDESLTAVDKWLASHGFNESTISRSPAKDWATIRVPVGLAEKMLDTKYHIWHHVESGDAAVRTMSYSLPEDLHGHIDLVQPTTLFSRFKPQRSTISFFDDSDNATAPATTPGAAIAGNGGTKIDPSCNKTVTISCVKQIYNAVGYNSSKSNGNHIGITGYLEQNANEADLQLFYKDQRPDAVGSSFNFVSVKGGLNNQTQAAAGDEADLDVQFAFGISYPTNSTFYSTAGRPPYDPDFSEPDQNENEPYTDWLDYVLSHPNPPQTISTSYDDDEQTVPPSYAQRACAGFAQLGARGVSLMFSSGDGGVGDGDDNATTTTCASNDGKNRTIFIPEFPSSCPYVTSVGATFQVPEVAVSRFYSGGGFSNYFPRPAYQDSAVEGYLKQFPDDLYEGKFNRTGRGIPDVAALGDNFRIFYKGKPVSIGGTSASSPTFAGIISLLNDARIEKKQPPLGFLNPFLYKKGYKGLNDILSGHNSGCGTKGFNVTKGWDPVTGLGTPNFGELLKLVT